MSRSGEERELPGRLEVAVAREQVLSDVEPLDPVEVPLAEAGGRVTAEPVSSAADVPSFDASAMDGFAVLAGDCPAVSGDEVELTVIGESSAGTPWPGRLRSGTALSISTGAEVPAGADAVVKVEETVPGDGKVTVRAPVEAGQNIRARGEIMAAGTEVLAAGSRIGPVEIGLLASTGSDPVLCHSMPTVAIIATGDELVPAGGPLGPGQIWNSNLPVISAMVRVAGGEVVSAVTAGDTPDETRAALTAALDCDLTVICGGVSVGDHDHVKPALDELGAERRFWGLAMKPGRPAWFGTRGDSRVIGLPGNPVSAMAVFAILGQPLLRALSGDRSAAAIGRGRLLAPVKRLPDRMLAVSCRVAPGSDRIALDPIPSKGSHDFISLGGARALALIEPGEGSAEAGEEVGMIEIAAE